MSLELEQLADEIRMRATEIARKKAAKDCPMKAIEIALNDPRTQSLAPIPSARSMRSNVVDGIEADLLHGVGAAGGSCRGSDLPGDRVSALDVSTSRAPRARAGQAQVTSG